MHKPKYETDEAASLVSIISISDWQNSGREMDQAWNGKDDQNTISKYSNIAFIIDCAFTCWLNGLAFGPSMHLVIRHCDFFGLVSWSPTAWDAAQP